MVTIPGTTIPPANSGSTTTDHIIDDLLTPRLGMFRMICIFDEEGEVTPDRAHWHWSYGHWNPAFDLVFRKNGQVKKPGTYGAVDYDAGTIHDSTIDLGPDFRPRDTVQLTYQFDYFPVTVLRGIITQVVDFVNTAAVGPATTYTVDTMPSYWTGVVTDLAFAVCMERLILDYTLWKGRLIFAIGPNEVYDGAGGDVVSQLETLKNNAEQRADRTLENERFKRGNWLIPPTRVYYDAVRGIGGGRLWGPQTGAPYGKLRGWRNNKIWGNG